MKTNTELTLDTDKIQLLKGLLMEDVNEYKQLLDKSGIIYSYNGTISQNILLSVGRTIEEVFERLPVTATLLTKVFSVFTEQLHNIMSYSVDKVSVKDNVFESEGLSIIGFDKKKNKYYIGSGNHIENGKAEIISFKIDRLNKLNDEELREFYKDVRRTRRDKHERGAGLGFIEMARKSSEEIQYNIRKIDDEKSFFEIVVYI